MKYHLCTIVSAQLDKPCAEGSGQAPLQSKVSSERLLKGATLPHLQYFHHDCLTAGLGCSLTSQLSNKRHGLRPSSFLTQITLHLSLFRLEFCAPGHQMKASYKGNCEPGRQVEEKLISRFLLLVLVARLWPMTKSSCQNPFMWSHGLLTSDPYIATSCLCGVNVTVIKFESHNITERAANTGENQTAA